MTRSVTRHRDLRTGMSPWFTPDAPVVPVAPLAAPLRADVVVVGAGITGALVAQALSALGRSVLVLDRRTPAHGSTAASTALLQFEIDTPLCHLIDCIGFERARRAWLWSQSAVQDLGALIRQQEIVCAFRPRRALYLAGNVLGPSELAEEGRQRRAIGLPSAFLDSAALKTLAGIDREAALISDGAADVDPVRLTAGLLRRAADQGCRIFSPTELAEIVPGTRKVEMVTTDGVELAAGAVVFATGYELAKGVPTQGHAITSTWAFATPPQPQNLWGSGELIWEASDPYLYIRTTEDGRVIVGGEDEPISDANQRDTLLPTKIRALQTKMAQLLPRLDLTADFAWSGAFGASDDGLPSIGAVPGMPNCYAILGFGGNGLTFGMVASQVITSILSGQSSAESELFAFGR